jgi:hypothetical protein
MSDHGYCVFEAVNREFREVIIGITDHCSIERLIAAHAQCAPVWMTKWKPGSAEYRWVSCEMPKGDAVAFAATYSKSGSFMKLQVHLVG